MTKLIPRNSHQKSMSEAFVNSFDSYPIGYGYDKKLHNVNF
ncbi:hypothetical protein [Nitrosopumilus sp. Nsub]|nr:hypothetical protein [Nitrosopumilus sp. Nsub]